MKKILLTLAMAFLAVSGFAMPVLDPDLRAEMDRRGGDEKIRVHVVMKSQLDPMELRRQAGYLSDKSARRAYAIDEMKRHAEASQYALLRDISEMSRHGMTENVTTNWLANMVVCDATKAAILDIASRDDVEIVGYEVEKNWIPDGEEARPAASGTREITSNVLQVRANEVWAEGYTGQGVVVAVIDTGVNYNHLDVADHLWDGGSEFPHHGYDVKNNDNDPMDDMGHGSHCAGTVCGDGTAGSQTGMAPDATLMCVKCLDASGNGGAESIAAGIEWAVEHGCDLFSMSLGIANSSISERTLLRNACVNALNAEVVAAIAAGNEGDSQGWYPIPNNVRVPGSCPPPWLHPDQEVNPGDLSCSVCIGAVDVNDNAAYFTSHGPVTWTNTTFGDYPYNPGIGLIRPDVCAPGVNIKSLNYSSNTGYTYMDGTSMATPCAAGVMCLMLSKNIDLSPAEVCQILQETAVPLSEGKSNVTGAGRIDAVGAVEMVETGVLSLQSVVFGDASGNNDGKANPGESGSISLTLTNTTEGPLNPIVATLTTTDSYITITQPSAEVPAVAIGGTIELTDAFGITIADNAPAKQKARFIVEFTDGGEIVGKVSFSIAIYDYALVPGTLAIFNDDNGNGLLEPGETAALRVFVDNEGNELASRLTGTLSSDYEYLTVNLQQNDFGTIGAGMCGYADFNITLDAAAPSSFIIPLTLDLVDASGRTTTLGFNYKNACNIIFNLSDSYGDGWNGNSLTVTFSDGTPSQTLTISSGNSATYTIEVMSGTQVTLTWNNGSWPNECSFVVRYEDGTEIYSNSGGMSSPYTFEVNCAGGSVPDLCDPVENLTADLDGVDVVLTWEAPATGTPTGYEVYRGTLLLSTTTALTYTDPEVEEGVYDYCVNPVYGNCQGEFACIEVEVSACPAVQNLQYELEGQQLSLTWEAPEDPTGLIGYRILLDGEEVTETNELAYEMTLEVGDHTVCVRALYPDCGRSRCIDVSICAGPEEITYTTDGREVTLMWEAAAPAAAYNVYAGDLLLGTTTEMQFTAVFEPGITTVRIEANDDCEPLPSFIDVCICDPVADLNVALEYDHLAVTWSAPSAASMVAGYSVYLNGESVAEVTETQAAVTPVEGLNVICVTAFSASCESESVCDTVEICATVTGLNYTYQGSTVTFNWDAYDTADYTVYVDDAEGVVVSDTTYVAELDLGSHSFCVLPNTECLTVMDCADVVLDCEIPSGLRATAIREGEISLTWNPIAAAQGYIVYRNGEQITDTLTENAFTDLEMALDATYGYSVTALCALGVSDMSEPLEVPYYTGLFETSDGLKVYPNPTTDKVLVECEGMTLVEVFTVDGKLLRKLEPDASLIRIEGLDAGVYTLRIVKGDRVLVRRVVKF